MGGQYGIDPQVFYWMDILRGLDTFSCAMAIMLGICAFAAAGFMIICYGESQDWRSNYADEIKKYKHFAKLSRTALIVFVSATLIFSLTAILIPDRTTMLSQEVVKLATQENLNWTTDQIKSVVDYIVDAFQKLK